VEDRLKFSVDNGDDYNFIEFASYLTKEGIRHELTTPHTPAPKAERHKLDSKVRKCVMFG
jgi:16S rRNA G527 N7-methylase RsmG